MMWWILAVKAGKVNVGKLRLKTIQNLRLQQVGAMLGGVWGSSAALAGCAAIGIVTAGAGGVACAVVGSFAGGYVGSTGGRDNTQQSNRPL